MCYLSDEEKREEEKREEAERDDIFRNMTLDDLINLIVMFFLISPILYVITTFSVWLRSG